ITKNDIPKIVDLQRASFPDMAIYGMIWPSSFLQSHIQIFPEGQLCVEVDGRLIGSASSLIVSLRPDHAQHTWAYITGNGLFKNHDPNGDSLYGADISIHPEFRRNGIGTMLYNVRKDMTIRLNLRRILAGGRLYNYHKYTSTMSAQEYAEKVVNGELKDPVLSFQLENGFKFIKVLSDYLYDKRSLNYASFIEWLNPQYRIL
ncbi:MAG TPA: GNAT family N-acetyltransferase, partial [Candidatus Nitrosopolaris sp.]